MSSPRRPQLKNSKDSKEPPAERFLRALSGDLGTSGKEGTGSLARKDAVAKWRRSRHRFDAMDDLSKRALRKYGYSVRERRRRKPS